MSTVGASSSLGGLVDLNVDELEVVHIKVLVLGVGRGVLEHGEEDLARLGGPAGLTGTVVLELLTLRVTANVASKAAEGNSLLVLDDVVQVRLGVGDGAALKSHGSLTGVLE